MNATKKPNEQQFEKDDENESFAHSEFSNTHHILEFQIENLKKKIHELEKSNVELKMMLSSQEKMILHFAQKIEQVRSMPKNEDIIEEKADSDKTLRKKLENYETIINAYEDIMPPVLSFPFEIMENILSIEFERNKVEIETKLFKMEERLNNVNETLKEMRKINKKLKKNSKKNNSNINLENMVEALNGFRNFLKPETKSEDLIYMDGWDFKIDLPLENFKKCVFSMLQAQEIVQAFHEGWLKSYVFLKENVKNFQSIVEIFPKNFQLPGNLISIYKEIVDKLKEYNICIQNKCPQQMKTTAFQDLDEIQRTLIHVLNLNLEMREKGNFIQGKINSLFPEIRKFIKEIYVKTKEVRGAEIKHLD